MIGRNYYRVSRLSSLNQVTYSVTLKPSDWTVSDRQLPDGQRFGYE